MTSEEKNTIDMKVNSVLSDAFGDKEMSFPINLGQIADIYELRIISIGFPEKTILGAYDRVAKNIYVAEGTQFNKMSFTIAHEIGHHILHASREREIFYRLNYINLDIQDGPEENEANYFAASLLMPAEYVHNYWTKENKDKKKLADIFGVSEISMTFRLKNLGLI